MSKSQLLLTVVLGIVCLGIIGFCIWSVVRGGPTELILGAAVVTLGLAQLVSFTARDATIATAMRRVSEVMGAYSALARELHSVSRRLDVLESGDVPRLPQSAARRLAAPAHCAAAGTAQHRRRRPPARRQRPRSAPPAQPVTNGSGHYEAPHPSAGRRFEEERFDLYLEPIVQIEDGSTRHYRASLSLRMADGTRVGMDTIQHQATRAG